MLTDLNSGLFPIYIYGTTHVFRHVYKRTSLGLVIREYFYENGEGTSKDFDSKITYKLLIKNSQSEMENPFNIILSQTEEN